jgi:GH3 auxin-responsive promoter
VAGHARWLAHAAPALRAFRRALRDPREAQEGVLRRILAANADSQYGRRHGFGRVRSMREYQERVPVASYDDLLPQVDEIARGGSGVLTAEPVVALERTTGSSGACKLMPFTESLLRELRAGVLPWMADLYLREPSLMLGGAYWSVSPLGAERERTPGGIPIGFEDDVQYLGHVGPALARVMLTPPGLARIPDLEACRYVTLRFLLEDSDLRLVSVWHPSFFALLLDAMAAHLDALVHDVERGTIACLPQVPEGLRAALQARVRPRPARAARLRKLLTRDGTLRPAAVWPHLRVVSCWADGAAAPYAADLARRLPQSRIQPKGLLATEGVVSIPWGHGPGAVLAVTSHVLEFVPEEGGPPRRVDELERGGIYSVLLTTGGGLYRYALGDRVRVVGRAGATPRVEFVGRERHVSDLFGEKLHEARVRAVVDAALGEHGVAPVFVLVAPETGTPASYVLFVEGALSDGVLETVVRRVEDGLREGHHYAYCRRLGQLGALRGFRVRSGGAHAYLERLRERGQRAGSIKPALLSAESGWSRRFEGGFADLPAPAGTR